MTAAKKGSWVISAEANDLAAKLMDYDNCHDGDIDAAAGLLIKYAKMIEDLTQQRDALILEKIKRGLPL